MDKDQDRINGEIAIRYFYEHSKSNYSGYHNVPFEVFLDILDENSSWFLSGLGLGIVTAEIDEDSVKEAMEKVSDLTVGQIPQNLNLITQAVTDSSQNMGMDFWQSVLTDSIQDLVEGAEVVGQAVVEGGKGILSLTKNAKIILIGGGILFLYFKYGLKPKKGKRA